MREYDIYLMLTREFPIENYNYILYDDPSLILHYELLKKSNYIVYEYYYKVEELFPKMIKSELDVKICYNLDKLYEFFVYYSTKPTFLIFLDVYSKNKDGYDLHLLKYDLHNHIYDSSKMDEKIENIRENIYKLL